MTPPEPVKRGRGKREERGRGRKRLGREEKAGVLLRSPFFLVTPMFIADYVGPSLVKEDLQEIPGGSLEG